MEAFKNLAQVTLSPVAVFERVKENPSWLIPLALLVIVSVVAAVVSAPLSVQFAEQQLLENADRMSPEKLDQAREMINSPFITIMAAISGSIGVIVSILVQAGLLHLAASVLGGSARFGIGLATVAYAQVPIIFQQIVQSVYMAVSQRLIMPGLSGLLPGDQITSPFAALLGRVDIFIIWSIILIAVGLSVTYKMSKGKAGTIAIGYWLVSTVFISLLATIGGGF